MERMKFEDLVGKTIVKIDGASKDSEEIRIHTSDGLVIRMHHEQDCCESVSVSDVEGDIGDLIGYGPLVLAEESSQSGDEENYGTSTWTFYRLATEHGFVVIRWLGESNGYYSESVDVSFEKDPDWVDPNAIWAD
jgi:hypothetical protein